MVCALVWGVSELVSDLVRGNQLLRSGKLEEAVAAYQKAIAHDQTFHWYHYKLGKALEKLGRLEEAVEVYREAIQENSSFYWVYQKLGETLSKLERLDEAEQAFRQGISVNKNAGWLHWSLGRILAKQQRWEQAITSYRLAVKLGLDQPRVLYELGQALSAVKQWDEAIAAYQKAIKKDANQNIFSDLSIYTLQRLGDALINRKDWEQAISCYHRLLDLKPDYFQHIYDALGTCFIETKRWEYVAQVYKKAITQVEVMPQQAYNNLFKSYEQLGHFDEAVNVCKEAIKLMPTYPGSYWNLGNLLWKQKLWNEAIIQYSKVVELQPNYLKGRGRRRLEYTQKLSTILNDDFSRNYDKIWEMINQPLINNFKSDYDFPKSINQENVQLYFTEASSYYQVKIQDIETLSKNSNIIEKLGVNHVDNFYQNIIKISSYESIDNQKTYEFKLNAVKNGYVESICPVSGEILRSNHSFVVGVDIQRECVFAYRFAGTITYYLFVGYQHGCKMFIYFPCVELVVVMRAGSARKKLRYLCNKLKSYMVSGWSDVVDYLSDSKSKELVAIASVMDHFGHTVLNEYPSYHELSERNLLINFKKYIIGGYEFIPFDKFFPEVNKDNIIRKLEYNSLEMFEYALTNNYFIIRPTNGSYNLNRGLAKRIYSASVKSSSETCLQEIEVAKKHFPVLWLEIRTNDRIWLNQAEGIAEIANRLYSDYPNLAIIFAGWSCLDSDNSSDKGWIEKDKQVVEESRALIAPNIPTFAVVGYKIYEKIAWAGAANVHIVTYGSGSIFASIANKPSVIHANTGWYPVESIENLTKSAHPGWTDISVVPIENITEDQPEVHFHVRNYYCNLQGIYHEIVKLLNTLNPKA